MFTFLRCKSLWHTLICWATYGPGWRARMPRNYAMTRFFSSICISYYRHSYDLSMSLFCKFASFVRTYSMVGSAPLIQRQWAELFGFSSSYDKAVARACYSSMLNWSYYNRAFTLPRSLARVEASLFCRLSYVSLSRNKRTSLRRLRYAA